MNDGELVERAQRGDIRAYEDLVRIHQAVAFRTACLITHDPEEAEDVIQDAFVKAHLALPRFRSGSSFRPWLLTIVANEARNRMALATRRSGLRHRLLSEVQPYDLAPPPETAAVMAERRAMLLSAVHLLSEQDQLIIGCRYFLGLSEAETAEVLKCRRGTVKSRLSRALDRLRGIVSAADFDRSEVRVVHE